MVSKHHYKQHHTMRLHYFNSDLNFFLGVCLIYVLSTLPALAEVNTITNGKDLMISCQQAIIALEQEQDSRVSADQNDAFLCMAYLAGVMATAQHANELAKLRYSLATDGRGSLSHLKLYCFNWQLPYQKIARIVLNFGHKQPHYLPRPAHELAIRALQTAFPCR